MYNLTQLITETLCALPSKWNEIHTLILNHYHLIPIRAWTEWFGRFVGCLLAGLPACLFVCLFASSGCWSVGRSLAISSKSNQRTSQLASQPVNQSTNHLNKYTHSNNCVLFLCLSASTFAFVFADTIDAKFFGRTTKNINFIFIY